MGRDSNHQHSVPNALMISRTAGHPFWLHIISRLATVPEGWGPEYCTGPVMLFNALRSYSSSDIVILPPEYFYPIDWTTAAGQRLRQVVIEQGRLLTEEEKRTLFPNAFAVTYWAHTW
jgi:mannosyltransferase OCH1-like enzyme